MQIEAEIPYGLQPGQFFQVQTPQGIKPVQVPTGARPGEKVRFEMPMAPTAAAPVLMGRVGPQAYQAGYQGPARPYRYDPKTVQVESLPLLQGIPGDKAEMKVNEIHKGGELAVQWPPFPGRRRCQDAFWILPFVVVVIAVVAAAAIYSHEVSKELSADVKAVKNGQEIRLMASAGAVGGAASLLAALGYVILARAAPACVVWTSLIFGPTLTIILGLGLLAVNTLAGVIFILVGCLSLSCVFCCYRPFIPFMIKLVETVSSVIKTNPMTILVSLLGSLMGIAWTMACGVASAGVYVKYKNSLADASRAQQYALYFAAAFIFLWGAQVASNVAHVTYCGVFGRWYHKVEPSTALRKSLLVALTTSFGSICFGSLLVAAVRAVEALLRRARAQAQEDGNAVCCVLLLVLQCVVQCIGDILEYFSEWAYVQCAVRGVSFIDAARITYAMMTCSNVEYILQDLLVNSVVSLGAFLCGLVGGGAGAAAGFAFGPDNGTTAIAGAIIGFLAGLMCGGSAASIISSGTKTILACWAEDPEPLRQSHPEIHQEFESRILSRMADW